MHYRFGAVLATVLAMFFSVPGFVSQRKKLKINSVRDGRLRYERYNPSQHKAGARSNSFLYTLKSEYAGGSKTTGNQYIPPQSLTDIKKEPKISGMNGCFVLFYKQNLYNG